jgi:antitoxin ParD1/3/4
VWHTLRVGDGLSAATLYELLLLDKKTCYPMSEGGRQMTTVTISLPDSLKEFVDKQLATKGYGNVSEYFRSLLREAQAKEEDARLEALLLEGLASKSVPLNDVFWNRLEAKTEKILEKHAARKKTP